jgi:hypothetical protein
MIEGTIRKKGGVTKGQNGALTKARTIRPTNGLFKAHKDNTKKYGGFLHK